MPTLAIKVSLTCFHPFSSEILLMTRYFPVARAEKDQAPALSLVKYCLKKD